MIGAIAGRTQKEADNQLSILAVGDDDQSIYGFRGANVEFIRRFKADYNAEIACLGETDSRPTPYNWHDSHISPFSMLNPNPPAPDASRPTAGSNSFARELSTHSHFIFYNMMAKRAAV